MTTRPVFSRRATRGVALAAVVAVCAVTSACNLIDAAMGRGAKLTNMVPGGNVSTGGFDCWLTFQFDSLPEGADPRDVTVRFTSIALERPIEFNWEFIAANDYLAKSDGAFGAGHKRAEQTVPGEPPPLGLPVKALFPLPAKQKIENAPSTLWLNAELYWGGRQQDSIKRTIEHVYASSPGGFF